MSLKTSFFSKTLLKSDFKRLWWIPVLHSILLFLSCTFPYMQRFFEYRNHPLNFVKDADLTATSIYNVMDTAFVFSLIIPVILAVFLFSYMQSGKASTFAHSIPVSRGATFVSHCVSGIAMLLIPLAVNCIILLMLRTNPGFADTFYVSQLFACIGIAVLYSLVAFSLGVLVAMITGNVVANIFFTYVFGFLPLIIELFCTFFADTQLYGFVYDSDFWCTEYLYLAGENILSSGGVILYICMTAVFLAGAYFLYRARNMENHSEVVAFPVLRPVFVFCVAAVIGGIGYAYIYALFGVASPWVMLPFGLVGLIIATMIVKKSFRHLKLLKPAAIYVLMVACVFSIFHFDLTGFEKRVPDAESVEYVTFRQTGVNNYDGIYYASEGREYTYDNKFSPDIKSPEEIKSVTELHSFLTTTERAELTSPRNVTLTYKLKNGKTLKRQYSIDYGEYKELLEPVITTDTIRKTYFPVLREGKRNYLGVSVTDVRIEDNNSLVSTLSDETIIEEFLTALKADASAAPYDEYADRSSTFTEIALRFKEPASYLDGTPVPDEELRDETEYYSVRPSYKNTQAVIEKYSNKFVLPEASDIVGIGVEYYGMEEGAVVALKTVADDKFSSLAFPYVIEAPEDIAEVYDYCCKDGSARYVDMYVVFFLENGHTFSCELNSQKADLPKCLRKIIAK